MTQSLDKVETQLCIYFVSTLYQLCVQVDTKSIQNFLDTKLWRSWYKVDAKTIQSWYEVDTQLCIDFASTLYQSWCKVATQFCRYKVDTEFTPSRCEDDTKLIQSWYTTLYRLCINFVSTLLQLFLKSWYKVDTQLSWYKVDGVDASNTSLSHKCQFQADWRLTITPEQLNRF